MQTKIARPLTAYSFLLRTIITIIISMMVFFVESTYAGVNENCVVTSNVQCRFSDNSYLDIIGIETQSTFVRYIGKTGEILGQTSLNAKGGNCVLPTRSGTRLLSTSRRYTSTQDGHNIINIQANVEIYTYSYANLFSCQYLFPMSWSFGASPIYTFPEESNLSLLSSTPNSTSTNTPTNTLIALNFSRPVSQATVPGNIILERTGLATMGSMDIVAYSGSTIVLRPSTILDKNASYTVRLMTGLKDIDGEALGSETTFSFTTASEPAQPGQDGIVSSTSLSPSCILGYSPLHPECILLNQLVINANDQVVYGDPASTSTAGDPVSLPTGEFTYSNALMHIRGDGLDYDFALAYKSQAYSNGPVGISWDHSYNIFLRENVDGSVTYFDGKFGVYTFTKDADGKFTRLPGIEADLVKTDMSYELRFTNGTTDIFNTDLRIASIRDKDNHALTFTYTGDKLTSTTDTLGRTITYDYYDHGRLKSITDFSGRTVMLAYYSETDEGGSAYDLKSITINNGADPRTISFTYQKDATSEILSHNILTLTDSKGNEYVKNTYDADDRVVSQKYGDGTLTYVYETDTNNPKHITKTTATNKRGMKSEFVYDENGNTLSKTLFNGDVPVTTTYTYATNGKIATETKPLGNGISYQYDAQNRLIEKREKSDMTQPNNDTNDIVTKYEYATTFSIPTKIIDPNGTVITTVLDTKGNITETKFLGIKKADGSTYDVTSTFTYDTDGHLITKTDGVGNSTKYEYSSGRVMKVIEGNGDEATTTLFSYDTHGNLTEITDGEGNIKKFTFDQYDRLTSSLSTEGIFQSIEYDANNNKTAQKVELGNGKVLKSTSVYDILDQVVENTIGSNPDDQRVTKIVRDANGNITETIDARGLKTKYTYDLLDQITEKRLIIDSNDQSKDVVTKYTYNKNGNITQITDPKGSKTTYTYDGFGRVISSTDTNNTTTKYEYDKAGNITATNITDANGVVLVKGATTFNNLGKALTQTVTDPKTNTSKVTVYIYDQNGNVTSKTDPKGNVTSYIYNSHNKIRETIDPAGNKIQLTYDKRGLVTSKTIIGTNAVSLTTSYVYDRDGRLIKETNAQQQSKTYIYNKQNKIIEIVDEAGNKTNYTYDVFGNVLTETKYVNNKAITTTYTYDSSDNLASVTDANGNKTSYEYDSFNRRTKEMLPDGSTTTYTYDANNNLASYTDPNGTKVTNTYDTLNRLTHRAIAPATGVIGVTSEDYAYDTLGRLVSGNDSQNNAVAFRYDAFNNLTSEMNNGKTIGYEYDANSNLMNLLFPSGKKLDRTYDQTNRLTGISLDGKNLASYGYNSFTLDSLTLANGTKTTYSYDALLRLKELTNIGKEEVKKRKNTAIQDIMINTYAFSYDSIGNITSNGQDAYGYDALSRLTNITTSNPIFRQDDRHNAQVSTLYNYDSLGNRDSVEQTTIWDTKKGKEKEKEKEKTRIADYVNNNLNQYTSVTQSKNKQIRFTYDKNGNLTDDGKQRYVYDYRNRLIKVTNKDGEIKAEFSYDILGRRTAKTTYNDDDEVKKIIRYTYSNQDAIQEDTYSIRDGKEKLKNTKEYIYGKGIDDILVMILTTTDGKKKTENRYFYQKDQLGSITAITDKDGKVIKQYRYDAFGKVYEKKDRNDSWREYNRGDIDNTRLFTGREYDKEIGLYYYRARYYSADLGRFISRDPIGMSDDINLYSYVGNNPVKFVDPMGMEKTLIVGFIGKRASDGGGEILDYNNYDSGILDVLNALSSINTTKGYFSDHYGNSIDSALNYIVSNKNKFNKIDIIGHSLGGDNAVVLANKLNDYGIKVNLLVTLDIKSIYENDTIYPNVKTAINYYQTNDSIETFDIFGNKIYTPLHGEDIEASLFNNTSSVTNVLTNEYNGTYVTHTNIDNLLSNKILDLIKTY